MTSAILKTCTSTWNVALFITNLAIFSRIGRNKIAKPLHAAECREGTSASALRCPSHLEQTKALKVSKLQLGQILHALLEVVLRHQKVVVSPALRIFAVPGWAKPSKRTLNADWLSNMIQRYTRKWSNRPCSSLPHAIQPQIDGPASGKNDSLSILGPSSHQLRFLILLILTYLKLLLPKPKGFIMFHPLPMPPSKTASGCIPRFAAAFSPVRRLLGFTSTFALTASNMKNLAIFWKKNVSTQPITAVSCLTLEGGSSTAARPKKKHCGLQVVIFILNPWIPHFMISLLGHHVRASTPPSSKLKSNQNWRFLHAWAFHGDTVIPSTQGSNCFFRLAWTPVQFGRETKGWKGCKQTNGCANLLERPLYSPKKLVQIIQKHS